MPNARSLANLRPGWQPGQSGNPKGRGPGKSIQELLHAELARLDGPNGETNIEYLLHRLVHHACHGNMRAVELVLAYAYGKPEQPVRLIEEQVRRIAVAKGFDPDRAVMLLHEYGAEIA